MKARKPEPNAHKTILARCPDYRKWYRSRRQDRVLPCGLVCSELYAATHSDGFAQFQKSNKSGRSRMFRGGSVGTRECLALMYRNQCLGRSTSLMDSYKLNYFLDKPIHPLMKWPGGKVSDLKHLRQNNIQLFPKQIERYFEPFLGGGAVWLAVQAKEMLVNDLCAELIAFYKMVRDQDEDFFASIDGMAKDWKRLEEITAGCADAIYNSQSEAEVTTIIDGHKATLTSAFFCEAWSERYFDILKETVKSKLKNIRRAEGKRNMKLPAGDVLSNIEGAFKAGLYTTVRAIMNETKSMSPLKVAAFTFIRDYCYSAMFRYNSAGDFNVPYGGISYNERSPDSKVAAWREPRTVDHLRSSTFEAMDFLDFLRKHKPQGRDFIFVDPPYDSDFSTYANNEFDLEAQKRLADYLCDETDAQFMAVMKNTEYIYGLYQGRKGVACMSFDKNYAVSFMNRNVKKVQHLVVVRTNG